MRARIARIWHGRVPAGKAAEYRRFLVERAIPDYESVEGCLGVQILERREGGVAHFLVVSYWEDMEAVKRFAGPQPEKAKYYEEDKEYLLEFEPHVRHYVVAADTYGPG